MPLEKESLNNFLPDGFETNNLEGAKENFSADKIATGYEKDVKDRVSGPNFNNLLDVLGKNTNVLTKFMDFIKNMPINNLFTVDENNQLVYKNIDEVGGSGLELCDIGTALYIDETKGLRRYLNGQIVDINTNTQAFLNRLQQITTLHPSLLCTENEWQTTKTMSAFGQVGKFVFNYSGDDIVSVRIPAIVNVQGLFDLQNLGMTVSAGLPNITGDARGSIKGDISGFNGAFTRAYTSGTSYSYGGGSYGLNNAFGFDASLSNPIYGNSNTVQPEAIQYPYFIQIATGAETENNIINDIELNNPYSLFDSKYSDHELNNLSWLWSEGQWNPKATYPTAYDKLLKVYNGTETVEGLSVKLSTENYTDYDFVLNTVDKTFRLPLLDGSEDLPTSSLINIDTSHRTFTAEHNMIIHVLSSLVSDNHVVVTIDGYERWYFQTSNAYFHRAGGEVFVKKGQKVSITGTTDICRYCKTKGNGSLYYYVGETVQNANLIDAGRIGEQLANKADKSAVTTLQNRIYIKSSYINGTSWYRIWSDGWCEQGGATASATGNITISFLKTFANTNYYANVIQTQAKNGSVERITSRTTTSMVVTLDAFSGSQPSNAKLWRACGYLASGQY